MKKNTSSIGAGAGGGGSSTITKPDRKTVERDRRIHMKALYLKLTSLIPHRFNPSEEIVSQQDQFDLAPAYIKHLQGRLVKLKEIKEQLMKSMEGNNSSAMDTSNAEVGSSSPVFELREMGSGIEVVLITGLTKIFMLSEAIAILEQEGAEVVSASFSTLGGKIFHTLHAQAKLSRVGVETTRARQRLKERIRSNY